MHKSVLALVILPLLWRPIGISAQTASQPGNSAAVAAAVVRGTVTDPDGALVPDAEVVLHSAAAGVPDQTTRTARDGHYSFTNVAPGAYSVRVAAAGFASFEGGQFTIAPAKTQMADVQLRLETEQVHVNVSADAGDETDPNNNGNAIVLKAKDLDNLSNEPSILQQELQAISGGDSPAMYVDGFSGGTLPPKNTIREIRINQNPYSARNDTDPGGGMIEIFTKPGSDKLHGDMLLYGNDSAFNTQDPFTHGQPAYHSTEWNGDVNGPLNKHASYFLSFNRNSTQSNALINAEILNPTGQNQVAFTQALPSPNVLTSFSPRLDLQLGTKSTVVLRYSYTKMQQTNGGIGQFNLASQGYDSSTTTQLLQASNSQIVNAKFVNDTRFQYIRTRSGQTPYSTAPTLAIQGAFTGGGSNSGEFHDNRDSYELQNYLSIQAGKHYLSPGIRLRINRDANVSRAGYNGEFLFSTLAAYQTATQALAQCEQTQPAAQCDIAGASQFSLTTGTPAAIIDVVDFAAFYQDDWKVRPSFTLSYGLRYEVQNYISDHGDFAPRLGFAWSLGAKKDKPAPFVVRGGSGIFYTRFAAGNILQAQRQNGVSQQQYVVASPTTYPNFPALGAQSSPTVYRISPDFRAQYGIMSSIGVDHPLGTHGSLSVNYFNNRVVHSLLTRNINAPLPGTYDPANPASGLRPYGGTQNIDEYESAGVQRTNRLSVSINFRTKNEFGIYGFYQYRHRNSDANGGFPSNGYDIGADWGRGNQDIRHQLFFNISSPLLYKRIHLSAYLDASSGSPFNITVAQDLNGDSQFNDRPAFATDPTRPSVIATQWGVFDTSPIAGQTIIPINYGRSPATITASTEIYREFTFGPVPPPDPDAKPPATAAASTATPKKKPYVERKYSVFFAIEADNVINHVNLAAPVGTLGSPLFGQSLGLSGNSGATNANRVINLVLFARF
ncbi:MAG TPA: carboxypeptidase regulatory-like domain-containing protein [Acidobacteriaceae bacterium]|nr:carboxypeptidase regulatory-like domain-containing protein [Acidobacteriaceae bacterium]